MLARNASRTQEAAFSGVCSFVLRHYVACSLIVGSLFLCFLPYSGGIFKVRDPTTEKLKVPEQLRLWFVCLFIRPRWSLIYRKHTVPHLNRFSNDVAVKSTEVFFFFFVIQSTTFFFFFHQLLPTLTVSGITCPRKTLQIKLMIVSKQGLSQKTVTAGLNHLSWAWEKKLKKKKKYKGAVEF